MEGAAELAFGIAALVYASGLALFRLPLLQVRRWGWTLMMHSWSGVAVFALIGSIALIKAYMANFLQGLGYGLPLAATFDDAIASASAARDMAYSWVISLSYASIALGALQGIIMLAMTVLYITGAGLILATIASYLFGAVFSLIIFVVKVLSGVVLFMEGVVAFVGLSKVVAPAMFTIGLVAFMIPFARTLGKTLIVLGAALTLALPVAIVAASPPPGYADQSIAESAEVQALSIAGRAIADLTGGVRYTAYDRENKTLYYPFLEAQPLAMPEIDRDKACSNLPKSGNITCDQIIAIIEDIIRTTPERSIFDTEGGKYYDAYHDGYRLAFINNTYARRVWFLNMWVTLHDQGPKEIIGYKIPEKPDEDAVACANMPPTGPGYYGGGYANAMCKQPYLFWKYKWETFWWSTNLYNETSRWMVAANHHTSFVWFTEQPWGTKKEDLNVYGITLPKVRETRWTEEESYECETDGNSTTVETCTRTKYFTRGDYSGNKSVYFVYLSMPDREVCETVWQPVESGALNYTVCNTVPGTPTWSYQFIPSTSNPPTWSHEVRNSSFEEIKAAGFIDGYGPYELRQSVEAIDRNEPLVLNAPTEEKKVYVTANQTIIRWSYDGYPDVPERLGYSFRVVFTASDSAPYLPEVLWEKFEEDSRYFRNLAGGAYVPDIAGFTVLSMRQDWAKYPTFQQGLYRDSPSHEAMRRINAKLLEYRSENWESNQTIFDTRIPLAKAVTDILYKHAYGSYAGSNIQIPIIPLLITPGGGVAILKPLSELIGQSIAIGVAMLFLAIVIDSFQAIVGGQSVMMRYFFSKVGNISHSIQFLSKFTSTVQRMSKVNLLGRMMARRQEDRLLKAAFEQWKHDRKAWENLRERIERMEGLKDRVTFAKQRYMLANRIQDRAFERLAELEGQPGFLKSLERSFLRQVARHHTLSEARIGLYNREFAESLRSNYASYLSAKKQVEKAEDIEMGKIKPEAIRSMAERGADDLIRSLKQRDTARMTPGEFARGAAEMLRSSSPLQRVALADSLVRSDAGRAIFWSYTLEPFGKALEAVGERVSSRLPTGSTLSHIGQQMDGHIRAPAAFSLAAQQPTNPSLPGVQYFGEGVKPTVPAGYVPDPKVGVFSAGRPSAEMPVVRDELLGGSLWDVKAAEEKVERYGAPTDIKGFDSKLPDFMEVFAHQDQAGFKLSDFMDGPGQKKDEPVVFNVERTVDGRPDVRINVEYEVPSSKVEQFTEWLESQKDVVGYSVSRPEVSQEDAQPYSETLHDWVGWPGAKETGQQADSSASQTHSESQYGWSKTQEQANESWSDWFGGESQSGAGVSGASATAEDAGPFDWFSGDRGPERASSGDMRGGRDGGR